MTNKLSLGITFLPQFPPEALVSYARQAEAAGFDSLWLYEDCFYAGAFTSAATLLAATEKIQVGIGLLPVTVRNPLFAAMEISTLARLYPGRFIAGFGHGYEPWIKQIGAFPKSTLKALEETVCAIRSLLSGEETTLAGSHVHLEKVQLLHPPQVVPPLYIGGVREKTLRLAGQFGDGTLLSVLSSPAYVRWANEHITAGTSDSRLAGNTRIVFVTCKASPDGAAARSVARKWVADCIHEGEPHITPLGIEEEARALFSKYGLAEGTQKMPEQWVSDLTASGTPDQAAATVQRLVEAGADSVVLAPVENDPASLQEIIRYLLPLLKS
jgi:5,10-methylenetetrahydromethanopterin reductase